MKTKTVSGIVLMLLFASMLTLTSTDQVAKADVIIVPDDYSTIQEAINAANPGDTIQVNSGVYYENVIVNKSVSLIGYDPATTIIDGGEAGTVVEVVVNDVFIANFTIRNSGYYWSDSGLYLNSCNNVEIRNNNITDNDFGLYIFYSSNNTIVGNNVTGNYAYGIYAYGFSNSTIEDNNISNNWIGIFFFYSSNDTITANNIIGNSYLGFYFQGSSNNKLRSNNISDNWHNFGLSGWLFTDFIHDVDTSNIINGKPIYYWINEHDSTVPSDAGYIALVNCSCITVQNLNLTNNYQGVLLAYTTNSTITQNNIERNEYGIHIVYSSSNNVSGNNLTYNFGGIYTEYSLNSNIVENNVAYSTYYGILLDHSSNNKLRNNNMSGSWYNFGVYGWDQSNYVNDIDTSNTVNGKPIYYWVNMSDMSVPFDAGYVALVNCTRITVQGLNLTNNYQAILLAYTQNSTIIQNNITDTSYGITLYRSLYNNVSGNSVAESDYYGIYLSVSSNNSVASNIIVDSSWSGIYIYNSLNNEIVDNNVTSNWYCGVFISFSSNNNLHKNNIANSNCGVYLSSSCSNNSIIANNIANNNYGVCISQSNYTKFYHNNFNNTMQVNSDSSTNIWDNGYPFGGNYWSDYAGVDSFNGPDQDILGSDGIGDTQYNVTTTDIDHYPLMAPFNIFDAGIWNGTAQNVEVNSNSTISDFQLDIMQKTIKFNVTGLDFTSGFCRITIPNIIAQDFWHGSYTVLLDDVPYPFTNWTDNQNTYIYIHYTHSEHEIIIMPEFSSTTFIALLMTASMLAIVYIKRRNLKRKTN